jgi:hypothetical protein
MTGVGVRTYAAGKVVAGRWRDNQLDAPLELRQAAAAAEGAAEAAMAARAVPVGGGRPMDSAALLAAQPAAWAAAAGLAAAAAGAGALPEGAAAAAAALAPANRPLMLMAVGITLTFSLPERRLWADAYSILAIRMASGLFVAANAIALLGTAIPSALPALLAALLVLLAPCAPAAREFALAFRLNEPLAEAAVNFSQLVFIPAAALVVVGASLSGLLPALAGEGAGGGIVLGGF